MKTHLFQFLAVAMLLLLPITLSAKKIDNKDFSKKLSFGLKAGANLSNVFDTKGDDFQADTKLGFAGGLFLSIPFTRIIGLQPEILFSQKGYRGSGSVLGSEYSFRRSTNYIDVPILFAVKPCSFVTLLVGPQYSFLLSQKYTFKSDLINISQQEQFDNENLRRNTLSIAAGVDVNLNSFVISARGGWDLLSNKGDGLSSTPRYKNMWYQATVGYRF